MSVQIIHREISSENDGKILLSGSQVGRVKTIGTDWTRLRIGVRLRLEDHGFNYVHNPRLWLGVMSDPTAGMGNGPLRFDTGHVAGLHTNNFAFRDAGPPITHLVRHDSAVRVGGATTTRNNSGTGNPISSRYVSSEALRYPLIFEMEKNGSDMDMRLANAPIQDLDYTFAVMQAAVGASTMTAAVGVLNTFTGDSSWGAETFTGNPFDEATNGDLTALVMAWNQTQIALEWSEIMFAKLA